MESTHPHKMSVLDRFQVAAPSSRGDNRAEDVMELLNGIGVDVDPENYLDIGGGDGSVTRGVANKFTDVLNIIDADIYTDMTTPRGVRYLRVENSRINIEDNKMDLVTMFESLHHFDNFNMMIKETHRVMRDGGILYIRDHDADADVIPYLDWIHMIYDIGASKPLSEFLGSGRPSYYSRTGLERSMRTYGFELLKSQDITQSATSSSADAANYMKIYHSVYRKVKRTSVMQIPPTPVISMYRTPHIVMWMKDGGGKQVDIAVRKAVGMLDKKVSIETVKSLIGRSEDDKGFYNLMLNVLSNR